MTQMSADRKRRLPQINLRKSAQQSAVICVLSAGLFLIPIVSAEELPSLDESISRALAHSPEVAMAHAEVSHAEAQVRAAKRGWFHPQISVFGGESVFTQKIRAGIQVTQDLDRLLTLNRDEIRHAQHLLSLARQELLRTQQRVIRQVAETRADVQRLDHLVHFRARTVSEREIIYHLVQTQFDVGAVPLDHLLAKQEALAAAEHQLLEAQLEFRQVTLAFAQLLGEPLPKEPEL